MSTATTIGKAVLTIVLLALVVGAGACGVCGGIFVINVAPNDVVIGGLMIGFGLAIIFIMVQAIRSLWRSKPPSPGP